MNRAIIIAMVVFISGCVGGYKFMMGHDGSARQVMNELGHGVKCN